MTSSRQGSASGTPYSYWVSSFEICQSRSAITSDPPPRSRNITVTNLYVHSHGAQLARLCALLANQQLTIPTPRCCGLEQAGTALTQVVAGQASGGVVVQPTQ